jgi:hypothetical protein
VHSTGTLDLASERLDMQVDVAELSLAGLGPLALSTTLQFEQRPATIAQAAWTLDGAQGTLSGMLALDGTIQVAGDVTADLAPRPSFTWGSRPHVAWPRAPSKREGVCLHHA